MKAQLFLGAASVVAAGALVVGSSSSCASPPDSSRFTAILAPDFNNYAANVDTYIQRRCGTLDCHGQPGRAYRIYGFQGFRLYNVDAGLISGVQPTTAEEVRANWEALVALEPEEMSRLMAIQGGETKDDLNRLLFFRKAQRIERHKGGKAMADDDVGFRCVAAWLRIPVARPGPDGLGEVIPPAERQVMNERAVNSCKEAAALP